MDRRSFFRSAAATVAAFTGPASGAAFPIAARGGATSTEVASVAIDEAISGIRGEADRSTLSTGYPDLDRITGGLRRGAITAIAARPSMGTTTLALNMARYNAVDKRLPVAIFSAPLGVLATSRQFISAMAEVDQYLLRHPDRLSDHDLSRIALATARLREAPILIDDDPFLTAIEVARRARDFALACGQPLGMVFIDQPKMLHFSSRDDGIAHMRTIMETLAEIAKELDVPIIVTTDIGRRVEHRLNKRPRLTDLLPASMPIARHANLFLLLYRDEVYDPDTEDKGNAEIDIAMNRMGNHGFVRLRFRVEWGRFESL